tara:strand:+ start:11618 stop:12712 length:1095 start_codon:yes stop_codon:yes gene_type:complete
MKTASVNIFFIILSLVTTFCGRAQDSLNLTSVKTEAKIRQLEDTIGFPQYKWQLDSILNRMDPEDKLISGEISKAVICPHDDYSYAAGLYKKTLASIKAKTIVLIGVAHRARNFDLKDKLIFGSYDEWKSANGTVKISPLRNELIKRIPKDSYIVHNEMIQLEHSLEAIVPFLQNSNPDVEIVPILIPYNSFNSLDLYSDQIAEALCGLMEVYNLEFGKDLAIVISSDAIHYGDEDWGSSNLAPFGTDSTGTAKAYKKDQQLIAKYLTQEISTKKIKNFNKETVNENNYMQYNWTWCGRYSIPFGLLMANKLNLKLNNIPLVGEKVDYRSSFLSKHIEVKDLGMGITANSSHRHWVGYAGIKYR